MSTFFQLSYDLPLAHLFHVLISLKLVFSVIQSEIQVDHFPLEKKKLFMWLHTSSCNCFFSELGQDSFLSHCCPLYRQSLCEKAGSGFERLLCGVLIKKLQESTDSWTGHLNIIETILKTGLNTIQSIDQFSVEIDSLKRGITVIFNPLPNKPLPLRVCNISLLKTLWDKEKFLVTSNFSFSHKRFFFCNFHAF